MTKLIDVKRHDTVTDLGLLVLRLAGGSMAIAHGWGKMQNLFGPEPGFADPIGIGPVPSLVLAMLAELVCGLLVLVGLAGRWAAIPVALTMAVAFFFHHAPDPFVDKELAWVYLLAFTTIALTGPGRYSLDGLLTRRR